MELIKKSDADKCQITIHGDLTIYQAHELKEELLAELEQHQTLEINMSEVNEIDTAGIQVLMLTKLESSRTGKRLRLIAHSRYVLEVVELFNLTDFFDDPIIVSSN